MTNPDIRPYLHKTDGELFLISESLEREIKTLSDRNAAIQDEMRIRGESAASGSPVLEYGGAATLNRGAGKLGDHYADRAKRYALQMTLIAMAVVIAITAVAALFL